MSKLLRLMTLLVLAVVTSACEAQCSVSTAGLSEAAMATGVDPETKAPTQVVTSFSPEAELVYATVKLSSAPADTKVKVTFHYLEGDAREITDAEMTTEGTRHVMFTLTRPTNGWPAGKYETRFYLNGEEKARVPFSIGAPQIAHVGQMDPVQPEAQVTQIAQPTTVANKTWRDEKFGYALEMPDTWGYRVTASKDYLFEGPKGTDAYEISLILQFVARSMNPGATTQSQLQGLVKELEGAPNGTIKTRGTIVIGGEEAPFVTATYNAKNSAGQIVPFAHTQLAAAHGEYFYLISFSGPLKIYETHIGVFEHLIDSFRFTKD